LLDDDDDFLSAEDDDDEEEERKYDEKFMVPACTGAVDVVVDNGS